jgi:hypothetical protein
LFVPELCMKLVVLLAYLMVQEQYIHSENDTISFFVQFFTRQENFKYMFTRHLQNLIPSFRFPLISSAFYLFFILPSSKFSPRMATAEIVPLPHQDVLGCRCEKKLNSANFLFYVQENPKWRAKRGARDPSAAGPCPQERHEAHRGLLQR